MLFRFFGFLERILWFLETASYVKELKLYMGLTWIDRGMLFTKYAAMMMQI